MIAYEPRARHAHWACGTYRHYTRLCCRCFAHSGCKIIHDIFPVTIQQMQEKRLELTLAWPRRMGRSTIIAD